MSTTHIHDLRRGVIELEAEGSLERVGSVTPEVSEIATRERFRSSGADSVAPVVFRERASGLRCVAVQESLVGFVEGVADAEAREILRAHRFARVDQSAYGSEMLRVIPDEAIPVEELIEALNRLLDDVRVRFATPNFWLEIAEQGDAWQLPMVNAPGAWSHTEGAHDVVIAAIDEGVDAHHPALQHAFGEASRGDPRDRFGRDFTVDDEDLAQHFLPFPRERRNLHGTACAGLIAARNDGQAVGVAPNCGLLAVKIHDHERFVRSDRLADAVGYAAMHAAVLSCSWAAPKNPGLEVALRHAATRGRGGLGCVIVAAAGNHPKTTGGVKFPASDPHVLAVGAVMPDGLPAHYSAQGDKVALVAPAGLDPAGVFTTAVSRAQRRACELVDRGRRLMDRRFRRHLRGDRHRRGRRGAFALRGAGAQRARGQGDPLRHNALADRRHPGR